MYAKEARRLRRAEKRIEWLEKNNQTLVISAKPEATSTLSLKKSYIDRVTKAVETENEYRKQINAEAAKYNIAEIPAGSVCLPHVAIYAAGYRKSNQITAR